jgi:hypothetical protein
VDELKYPAAPENEIRHLNQNALLSGAGDQSLTYEVED